jgi:hypothetical protein
MHLPLSVLLVLIPAVTSAVVALLVFALTPYMNLVVWKKQKRKEQQLAIAKRFAELSANQYARWGSSSAEVFAGEDEMHTTLWEQEGLLLLIPCIFKTPAVKQCANWLAETLKETPPTNIEKFQTYRGSVEMRNDLQAMLFAEALDIDSTAVRQIAGKWPSPNDGA